MNHMVQEQRIICWTGPLDIFPSGNITANGRRGGGALLVVVVVDVLGVMDVLGADRSG
jgi:hypothetical protein